MLGFILNIPWTLIGLILAVISGPSHAGFKKKEKAIILQITKFWWEAGYLKNARAMAMGHVVLLGPKIEKGDLEHELVHVRQFDRFPLIFPFLYYIELLRKGYRNNMYELEAYQLAGNTFKG